MSNKNTRGKRKELDPIDEVAIEQSVVEEVVPEVTEEPKAAEFLDGIVHNCVKLNVRRNPSIDSDVIAVINEQDRIKVKDVDTLSDWYFIQLPNGEEGFSMKKYIAVGV